MSLNPDQAPSNPHATPLPWDQLSLLFFVQLAEPITSNVIYPFIAQLVIELGVTHDPAKTGYFAGLVESLFFLTEAACVLHWGALSDRIGRRPVLMIGLGGLALSQICFGLASSPHHGSFLAVILARALAGALNGNVGVSKSVMGELTDETNAARAMALMPIIWNAGSSIGPLIGGGLAHPYERFTGRIFANIGFFREYPYALPCFVVAGISAVACIVTGIWFRETYSPEQILSPDSGPSIESIHSASSLPTQPSYRNLLAPPLSTNSFPSTLQTPELEQHQPRYDALSQLASHTPTVSHPSPRSGHNIIKSPSQIQAALETTPLLSGHSERVASAEEAAGPRSSSTLTVRNIMTPRLRAALTAYSLLALTDISYLALQPLFFSSPTGAGGLGLTASTIGIWMGSGGALNALIQAFLYPRLHARFGEKRLFIVGACAFCLMWPVWMATWTVAATLDSTTDNDVHWSTAPGSHTVWALLASSFGLYIVTQFCFAGIFMFVNNAAPRTALGRANGLAQTATSTMRAIGPAALTSLWSWSAGWLHRTHHLVADNGQTGSVVVGGVVVLVPAVTVYVTMEVFSLALVWSGTRLMNGRAAESIKPSGSRGSLEPSAGSHV